MSYIYTFLFEAENRNEAQINQNNYEEFNFNDLKLENKVKYIGFALYDSNIKTKCEPNKNSGFDSDYVFIFQNERDLNKARNILEKKVGLDINSNFFELDNKIFSFNVINKNNNKRTLSDKLRDARSQQDMAANRFLNSVRVRQYKYV